MKGDFVCVTDQDVQVAQGDVIYDGSDRYKVEYVYTITWFWNKVSHIELDLLLLK